MKKILFAGMLALGLALTAGQEAKAWVNFKFGVGLNTHYQGGGNSVLWGAFRGSQVPGPEAYGHGGFQPGYGQGQAFPYYGQAVPSSPAAVPTVNIPAPAPAAASVPVQQTYWNGANPYYTTGYNPSAYTPNYYFPTYYSAPSYWYGR